MAAGTQSGGNENLSLPTLVIAALASAAAAVLVSQFSESGSAMAAALTAIFVPLLREAFHRPARAVSDVRSRRRSGDTAATAATGAGSVAAWDAGLSEAESRRADPPTALLGSEGSSAGVEADDSDTRRLDVETRAVGLGHGRPGEQSDAIDDEDDFLAQSGAPDDILTRETRPLDVESPSPDGETRPIGADHELATDQTHRIEAGAPATDATRPLDDEAPATDATPPLDSRAASPVHGAAPGADARAPRRFPLGLSSIRRRPRVKIALVTGLLAFLIAAVALTVPELIAGGSIGGGEGRTTLFSGGSSDSESGDGAEDGVIDGGGEESPDSGSGAGDGGDGGGSSEPVPGGGGASEDPGDSGSRSGASEDPAPGSGDGTQQPNGGGSAPTPAPGAPGAGGAE